MAAGFQGRGEILRPLKEYRELSTGKGRREHGIFLVEGMRAVKQIIAEHGSAVDELVADETIMLPEEFNSMPVRRISTSKLRSITSSKTPQGIFASVRIPEGVDSSILPLNDRGSVVILEDVQDPGNIGTIIRTAVALDFTGIVLSRNCADPFSPKVVQSTAGAVLVPWIRRSPQFLDSILQLKKSGYCIFGADMHGRPHVDFSTRSEVAVAFGNEGNGLSTALKKCTDEQFVIPMNGKKVESLNVAVAAAITMFAVSYGSGW